MTEKNETFEQYLERFCFDLNPMVLDDDMPDFFDNWISNVDADQLIRLGQLYGEQQYIEGMRNMLNQVK